VHNAGSWQLGAAAPGALLPERGRLYGLDELRVLVRRVPRPVRQGLAALALYLTVFVTVLGWPLARHPALPQLRDYWTDPNFYVWSLSWWPYAITHGLNPLYSSQIGAPGGYALAWATTTPLVDLAMWPVTAVFGAVTSYNLVLLLLPPLAALAAFAAARRLTGRFWAALVAGAAYGFTPFELTHDFQGQPNLAMIALLPVLVYLMLRWWDGTLRARWFVVAAAVTMGAEFYVFTETFAYLTIALAAGLLIGYAVAGRANRRQVARLAGLTAAGYAGALVLAAPYLFSALRHPATALTRPGTMYSLYLARLVLPWTDRLWVRQLSAYSASLGRTAIESYVGLPLLLVLVALAVFARRSRLTWLLVIGFAAVIALAVGPTLVIGDKPVAAVPWGALWRLKLLRGAEPSRFIVVGNLILALALARWLAAPWPGRASLTRAAQAAARWALGLLAAAALFADLPTAYQAVAPLPFGFIAPATMHPVYQLPPFLTTGLYRRYIRPGEIVVFITRRGNAAMLFQAETDFYFRVDGGYINASLTPVNATPAPIEALSDPQPARLRQFHAYVKGAGVGAIIVEQAWALPWMVTSFPLAGLHGISVGGMTVYQTGAGAAASRTAQ
jgi:hypothetical protein